MTELVQTMELTCPKCDHTIDPIDINIATDLAKCSNCNSLYKASELASSIDENSLIIPPTGSKVELKRGLGEGFEIFLPAKGFTASDIPYLIFTILPLGILTSIPIMVMQGNAIFIVFTIPFLLISAFMGYQLYNSIKETQTLILTKDKFTIIKQKPFKEKKLVFHLDDIQVVKMKHLKANIFSIFENFRYVWKLQWTFGAGIEMPALISKSKTTYFLEEASDAEQEWITTLLGALIKKRKIQNS